MDAVGWVNAELDLRIWNSGARGNDLLVLLALSTFADRETARCWPSINALCARSGLNDKTVRAAIKRLEKVGRLGVERRDRRPSRFSILPATTPDIASSNSGSSTFPTTPKSGAFYSQNWTSTTPKSGTRTSPLNESNNETVSRRKRSTPIPDDWQPNDEHRAIVLTKAGVSLSAEASKFRDHALANDRRLADWDAGFRNWLRNARPEPLPNTPTARMQATLALASTPTPHAIARTDPHDHRDDGFGYCPYCQEKAS